MREKYRKSIASLNKFPQFTTMNVIDGQAGLIIYTSLIFYSLTIDNILNIIVLLILAGVTIATLTGENGILTQAGNAKTATNNANIEEQVKLAFLGSYGTEGKIDYNDLKTNLEKIEKIARVPDIITEGSFPLTVTIDGKEIKIFEDGTIFNSGEWDKTASDEDCFYWESDDPNNEGYGTVIGYTAKIENYTKLRYPSRCTKIMFEANYLDGESRVHSFTSRAFTNNILKVEIPGTVTLIGQSAFGYMSSISFLKLEEVTIPNSVIDIGSGAFCNCRELTSVEIPNNVTNIGSNAFQNTAWYNNQPDGLVYAGKVAYQYKGTMPSNTNIQIKEGTIAIASYAFYNCTNLTSITIPNSVTNIGSRAFSDSTSLSSIIIPSSISNIGEGTFHRWSSSQTINIQGYTSTPSGWDSNWNIGCSAQINWNQ